MASSAIEAGRAFLKLTIDDKEFRKGLDSSLKKLDSFGRSAVKIGATIGGAGAAISAPFLVGLKVFADTGSALNDLSERTGVAASQLSALQFAAEQSGTSFDVVAKALRALQVKGIDPNQFSAIAKNIAAIEDPTQRAKAAFEVFGAKVGSAILPMLTQLPQLLALAEKMGVVMSDEAAKSADALGDAFDLLTKQSGALVSALGSAIAPAVTDAANGLANLSAFVIAAIKNHQELAEGVGIAAFAIGGLGTALIAVGGAMQIASAGMKALGVAIALLQANPIILVITAIGALVGLIGLNIAKWLGYFDAVTNANEVTGTATGAQDKLAASMKKGTAEIDARATALARMTDAEKQFLTLAEQRERSEKLEKDIGAVRLKALREEQRSIGQTIGAESVGLSQAEEARARLRADLAGGREFGAAGTARARERLAQLDEEINRRQQNISNLEQQQAAIQGQIEDIDPTDANARREEARRQAEERQKAIEEERKAREEAEQARQEELRRWFGQVKNTRDALVTQFESAGRGLRGGTGGRFAEQIAGSSRAESREERMLKLSEEQRNYLKSAVELLKQSPPLLIGNT